MTMMEGYTDRNYTEAQLKMITLCERLQSLKPKNSPLNEFMIGIEDEPTEMRRKVATTALGQLLLPSEASFSIENGGDYYPELEMTVGSSELRWAGLSVYKYAWQNEANTNESMYELSFKFGYVKSSYVTEVVGVETATTRHDVTPSMQGHVWAMDYAETGYEGHNFRMHKPSEIEALGVLALIESLTQRHIP